MVVLGVGFVTLVVVALIITNVALRRVSGTYRAEQELRSTRSE